MRTESLPQVDSSSSTLRYIQAKNILAEAIRSGAFPAGSKLPSTSEIGTRLNVSLITAHKAIQCLVEEGWLRRERGRGTFVRDDFQKSVAAKPKFRVGMILQPGTVLLEFYHGALMASLRHAAESTDAVGELVIQRCNAAEDLDRIDADGFLVFHPSIDSFPHLEEVAKRKPIVVLGGSTPDTSLHCVDSQHYNAARETVRHLVEFGHERIAIINGPMNATNAIDRHRGFVDELEANGLPLRPEFVFDTDAAKSGSPVMGQIIKILRSPERPTAIIVCGYYVALDVMILLRRMQLKVGSDVSLVGFDDPKSASLLDPALTAVQQPLEEMGARAYQRIVQMINGENPSPRIELLPTSLIVRESTGPVL